jgi:hypothetical protein
MELNIMNLFGFTFKDVIKDSILEWNENFVQDHPSCMFGSRTSFLQMVLNDEE